MAYKWPDKDKDEIVDFSIDWSRFLGADTISGVTWFINDGDGVKEELSDNETVFGLRFIQDSNTTTVSTARFADGTNNVRYTVTCRIITAQGLQYERAVFLRVREK
jgi:hypothetical protein